MQWGLCALHHGIQISMEAILACHPARSTDLTGLPLKIVWTMSYLHRPHLVHIFKSEFFSFDFIGRFFRCNWSVADARIDHQTAKRNSPLHNSKLHLQLEEERPVPWGRSCYYCLKALGRQLQLRKEIDGPSLDTEEKKKTRSREIFSNSGHATLFRGGLQLLNFAEMFRSGWVG